MPVAFLLGWTSVCASRPLRHLGTLHFGLYFLSIYSRAYPVFIEHGGTNYRFIGSVMAYPLLALAGALVFGFLDGRTRGYSGVVPRNVATRLQVRAVVAVSLVLFGALAAYLWVLGDRIPALTMLREGRDAGQVARFIATKGYNEQLGRIGPLVWTSRILIDYFGLFLLVYEYCRARVTGAGYRRLVVLFALLALATLAFNERFPIVKLVAYTTVFVAFGIGRSRVSTRMLTIGAVLFALLIPFLGVAHLVVNYGAAGLVNADGGVVRKSYYEGWVLFADRVLQGQVTPLYYIYEVVPRYFPYFGGRTFSNPRGIFPYEAINLNYLIYDWYQTSPEGVRGSDPTVFFGELYANFGLSASLACMFVSGMVIQWANNRLARKIEVGGSPYNIALFYLATSYIADFTLGFITLYFDARMYLIILMSLVPALPRRSRLTGEAGPPAAAALTGPAA